MDDELERIKERKREELADGAIDASADPGASADLGTPADPDASADGTDEAGGTGRPREPVPVENREHFADVVADNGVVLADFYADWCGPCKTLEPILEDVAAESAATVLKVDIDVHQQLAADHGVRGVPTLVLFADGEAAERVVGVREKRQLLELIDRHASR